MYGLSPFRLKRQKEKTERRVAGFIVIVFLIFLFSQITTTYSYERETTLLERFYETGGCAHFSTCPKIFDDRMVEEMGVYPPQYYKKDSKEYWKSFCSYSPEACK